MLNYTKSKVTIYLDKYTFQPDTNQGWSVCFRQTGRLRIHSAPGVILGALSLASPGRPGGTVAAMFSLLLTLPGCNCSSLKIVVI